jgi:hypothetical protein
MIAYTVKLRIAHVLEDDHWTKASKSFRAGHGGTWRNEAERVGRRVNGA